MRERFERAVDALVARVRRDRYVLAAVLLGSLAHDVVWEKSDVDLMLVTQEVRLLTEDLTLVEDAVNIHVVLTARGAFRRMLEGSIQSSFTHSLLSKGRMLFCEDEPLAELFAARRHLGARDRQIQLLQRATGVLPALAKAEKWLRVRGDARYCFLWLMRAVEALAAVETLWHGEIVEREVLQQALRHNPALFGAIYTELVDGPKTTETMGAALETVSGYLRERADALFGPILEHLAEAGGPRSATDINHHFGNVMGIEGLDSALEWLADVEVLAKVATPARLTERSRVEVQEAAYFYDGPPPDRAQGPAAKAPPGGGVRL